MPDVVVDEREVNEFIGLTVVKRARPLDIMRVRLRPPGFGHMPLQTFLHRDQLLAVLRAEAAVWEHPGFDAFIDLLAEVTAPD